MLRFALAFWLLTICLAWAEPRINYTNLRVKTLVSKGSSATKIDLVIIGDGYLQKDLGPGGRFERAAKAVLAELWTYNAFRDYRDSFNVHLIYLASKKDGRKIHYALGSQIRDARTNMVNLTRGSRVASVAAQAPAADAVIVLTTLEGRSNSGHGRHGRIVLTEKDTVVLAHELGHLLAGLGDEYSSTNQLWDRELHHVPTRGDLRQANLTTSANVDASSEKSIKKTVKWRDLYKYKDAYPLISAHQGGYYNSIGVWRPSFNCTMRSGRYQTFCPVCHKELVRAFHRFMGRTFNHSVYHRRHPYKNWK